MRSFVGLDVSQATTAICVVDEEGRTLAEGKVPTCPRAIAAFVRMGLFAYRLTMSRFMIVSSLPVQK